MDNIWFTPEGYASPPKPIRYRIRECLNPPHFISAISQRIAWPEPQLGEVVERLTKSYANSSRYFHQLANEDQYFGDLITRLTSQACGYFHLSDEDYKPLESVPGIRVSDAEVATRIARMNAGENTREAKRVNKPKYDLEALPWDQQRALIEQIEKLKRDWSFEFIGEAEDYPEEEPIPEYTESFTGYWG